MVLVPMSFSSAQKTIAPVTLYFRLSFYLFMVFGLLRVAFWFFAAPDMPDPLGAEALKAFGIGIRFDARIAVLMTLPVGALLCIPALARSLHRTAKLLILLYGIAFLFVALIYATDFGFYAYLHKRVSMLLFELLKDVHEAYTMVVESYPVSGIVCGILASSVAVSWGFYRILRMPVAPSPSLAKRSLVFFTSFLLLVLIVLGQASKSFFPLRWSDAYFSTNEAIIALGLNPLQALYDSRLSKSQAFSLQKAQNAYPRMATFLGVDNPDQASLNFLRHTPANTRGQSATATGRKPNIVLIFMESLSFPQTSFAPGKSSPTPHIQTLAKESLLYMRFFANARTTARSIFTTITGIPDINEGSTSSRNPMVVDQRVIGAEFEGYDKYYLMGGNAGWANIQAVVVQNMPGIALHQEGSWKSPHVDVWGISDYDLFRESHNLFASRTDDKPFLAIIQTASYHKPYTVPETPGFSAQKLDKEAMHTYGFESQKQYSSIQYSDFSLGHFMRLAKQAPYYRDTIFFIFGDHGLSDTNNNMPGGYNAAALSKWHVPMLIHASPELGLVAPGISHASAGTIDIFPTAAALAGIAHNNWTLGRNLLDPQFDASRATYICGNYDAPIIVVQDDHAYYNNRKGVQALFSITGSAQDVAQQHPEAFQKLGTLGADIDATARYILYNNKKQR